MAIIRKELKEKSKNVLLRVSIPAPLMAEIKKIKKLCKDTGFYFDIKPDVTSAGWAMAPGMTENCMMVMLGTGRK